MPPGSWGLSSAPSVLGECLSLGLSSVWLCLSPACNSALSPWSILSASGSDRITGAVVRVSVPTVRSDLQRGWAPPPWLVTAMVHCQGAIAVATVSGDVRKIGVAESPRHAHTHSYLPALQLEDSMKFLNQSMLPTQSFGMRLLTAAPSQVALILVRNDGGGADRGRPAAAAWTAAPE